MRRRQPALGNHREATRRSNRAMGEMITVHFQTLGHLGEEKKKCGELKMHLSTWQTVFQSMVDGLKKKDDDMEKKFNSVWRDRDEFCSTAEKSVQDFENFRLSYTREYDKKMQELVDYIKTFIKKIKELLDNRETLLGRVDKYLTEHENYEANTLSDEDRQEAKRLAEEIPLICAEYQEVENEIGRTTEIINQKTAELLEYAKNKENNLFSIVTLEDVKKLLPFKTASKQSNP